VGLARRAAEDLGAEARDVVARRAHRHHLDRAAGQAEGHRPDRRSARPLHHLGDGRGQDGNFDVSHTRLPLVPPVEDALAPDVDVAGEQDQEEDDQLDEAGPAQLAQRHRPRIEERDLDVEEQEDHRDEIELHRMPLARVPDRRHAALVGRHLLGRRTLRPDEVAEEDVEAPEARAEDEHDQEREPRVHDFPKGFAPRTPLHALSRGPHAPRLSRGSLAALVRMIACESFLNRLTSECYHNDRMRIAWFSPFPPVRTGIAGRSAELVAALAARGFSVDRYPEAAAHDFPWRHRQAPYDLVVYQFGNSSHHDYAWPYALRYPGLVVLHDTRLHHARAALLLRETRVADYRAELAWSEPAVSPDAAELAVAGFDSRLYYDWPMVRGLVASSRLTAVHGDAARDDLIAALSTPNDATPKNQRDSQAENSH